MTSDPIRVLHIIDQLADGGAQQLVWDLVRFADRGAVQQQVVSIMLDRGDFVYAHRMAEAGVYRHPLFSLVARRVQRPIRQMNGLPRQSLSRRSVGLIWRMACFTRAALSLPAKVAAFRPHLIHAHTMHSLVAALMLKKLFRLPLVHSVPCLISQMHDIDTGWLAEIYRDRNEDIDVFLTGASVEELRGLGVPEQKIRPIRGGIDVSAVAAATARREEHAAAVRAEIGAPPTAPVLLSVGRLHRSKGHDYALEAMPAILLACPDAHWIVLGVGEEHGALAARAEQLGIAERVHLLGFRDDPLPYYAAADVYFRTPVLEAENLCSYQAMAAALPVVGFDTGCETELIPTVGHGILVPNRDAAALAARTIEILSSPGRGRGIGEQGVAYAAQYLDTAPTIRACVDAYRVSRGRR